MQNSKNLGRRPTGCGSFKQSWYDMTRRHKRHKSTRENADIHHICNLITIDHHQLLFYRNIVCDYVSKNCLICKYFINSWPAFLRMAIFYTPEPSKAPLFIEKCVRCNNWRGDYIFFLNDESIINLISVDDVSSVEYLISCKV